MMDATVRYLWSIIPCTAIPAVGLLIDAKCQFTSKGSLDADTWNLRPLALIIEKYRAHWIAFWRLKGSVQLKILYKQ